MPTKVLFEPFTRIHGARYFWVALTLAIVSIALFILDSPSEPANGGTPLGYTLGITAALLIVWLAMFGVRKRRYFSRMGTVKGWLSAHIYLGIALLVIATLHSAAEIGWNIHTLAYLLMWLVVLSGIFGVWVYRHYPPRLLLNRKTRSRQQMLEELSELDGQCSELANQCLPDIQLAVTSAIERTAFSRRWLLGLIGQDQSRMVWPMASAQGSEQVVSNIDQARIIDFLRDRLAHGKGGEEVTLLQSLLELFSMRRQAVRSLQTELRIQGLLKIWLMFHIPMSIALLAALFSHVFAVLIYW